MADPTQPQAPAPAQTPAPDAAAQPPAPQATEAAQPPKRPASREERVAAFAALLKSQAEKTAAPPGQPSTVPPPPDAPGTPAAASSAAQAAQPAPAATPAAAASQPAEELQSPRLALLMKREREQLEREAQLKAKEAQLKAAEEAKSRGDLDAFLKQNGLDFQTVQDFYLNGKQPTPAMQTEAQLKSVRDEVQRLKAAQEEAQRQQEARTLAAWQSGLVEKAKASGEKYELFATHGAESAQLALQVAQAYFQQHGQPPPDEAVLQHVDAFLEKRAEAVLTTKRLKAKLAPVVPQPAAPQATSKSGPSSEAAPRTLTNSVVAAPPAKRTPNTREGRIAAMADAFSHGQRGK